MEPVQPLFRTLRGDGQSEIEIKRSRFLGRALPIQAEEDARAAIAEVRHRHPEARHHAFAYRVGRAGEIARFSDDGEPGGTAGRPIMEVLLRGGVTDAVVVVTRYFGGILLGSGGLTRAYSQTATEAVRNAAPVEVRPYIVLSITVDYAQFGALEQALTRHGLALHDSVFTDVVGTVIHVPSIGVPAVTALVADTTAGTALVEEQGIIYIRS
jgi:uncharacterized YigZ family protein